MFGPSGFFCFIHTRKTARNVDRNYAFAYKPPGPWQRGALDELMLDMCKGPIVPDAVVILGLDNEKDKGLDLLSELKSESVKVAQQRLKSRIPLIFAGIDLHSGRIETSLLDQAFRNRKVEFDQVIRQEANAWIESGLKSIFDPNEVVLRAPPGYAYQKPSGARSELFLKPDLALKSSANVAFVAFSLFRKLFTAARTKSEDLRTVFVDTMAISPVAYGLRELLWLCGIEKPFHIESFHSYGGFEEVKRPLPRTSLCIISASSSMSLHEQWIVQKEVAQDEVITLLTLRSAPRLQNRALLAIEAPEEAGTAGPAQLSIRIKGETFLPEQEPAKKVLLTDLHHRSDEDVSWFCEFAGQGVFDIFRRPASSGSKIRALYVDGLKLIQQPSFEKWLRGQLLQSVKAATRVIVYQDDDPSRTLADCVRVFCESTLGLRPISMIPASKLPSSKLAEADGVIVCAAVVGKGSQLLEISRTLRDMHEGPRLYLIGFQVAEARSELKALPSHLKHSKSVPYEVGTFGSAAIGTQLLSSYSQEQKLYYQQSWDFSGLPGRMKVRASALGSTSPVGEYALLPHGSKVDGAMRIRAGFAYWPPTFSPQACHAEVLATVGVLLQRAREHDKLPDERRLSSGSYRHVVLDPENFARFNDGVLQAALLRSAYPSELDYRADHAASDFMKALVLRILAKATEESGEAALEFIAALMMKRLQLSESHLSEVLSTAISRTKRPTSLQRAIHFLLSPGSGKSIKKKLPF